MLQIIKQLLLEIVDNIDAGNTDADEEELIKTARFLRATLRKDTYMNKYQAYTYLNIKRAQFDNLVRAGVIPKGKKVEGSNELRWYKKDIIAAKKKRESEKHC